MENQHLKIKRYRRLSDHEIDLMKSIEYDGEEFRKTLEMIQKHLDSQLMDSSKNSKEKDAEDTLRQIHKAEAFRWLSIARTHFEHGLMAATRAVARSQSF